MLHPGVIRCPNPLFVGLGKSFLNHASAALVSDVVILKSRDGRVECDLNALNRVDHVPVMQWFAELTLWL